MIEDIGKKHITLFLVIKHGFNNLLHFRLISPIISSKDSGDYPVAREDVVQRN